MCENIVLTDLLGSQYLFEILQTLLNAKNSENGVKCSKNSCDWELQFFSEIKEGYKVSFVKILIFC